MRRRTTPISFRVDDDLLRRIDEVSKSFGISRGDWVRGVIIARLHESDHSELLAQLEHIATVLQEQVAANAKLKDVQERSLVAILRHVGRLEADEVRQIFRALMKD